MRESSTTLTLFSVTLTQCAHHSSFLPVSDLRAALTLRGLSTEGLKVDLVNRLQARLDEEEFGMVDAPVVPVAPMVEPESTSLVPPPEAAAVLPHENDPEPEITTGITEKVHAEVPSPQHNDTPKVVEKGATTSDATSKVTAAITTATEEASATGTTTNTTSTTTTGQTVVLPKITPDMSFEEKRRIRAARFNMTLVEESNKTNAAGKADTRTSNSHKNIDNKRVSKNVVAAEEGKVAKKAKVDTVVEREEEELLPKEEVERRLKRLQKFSGEANQLAMDKLKAMLRKYRFMQKE